MLAWKNPNGTYRLSNDSFYGRNETYIKRAKIAFLGGKWDAKQKHWIVPAAAVNELKAARMYGVLASAYCHNPQSFAYADQNEVDAKLLRRSFCSLCDSRSNQPTIIQVFGETDVARSNYESWLVNTLTGNLPTINSANITPLTTEDY